MELGESPTNICRLRREYQILQRRLQKGQDTLQNNIQGLKSKQIIKRQTSRFGSYTIFRLFYFISATFILILKAKYVVVH